MAGRFDRRVQVRRIERIDNDLEEVETFADHGAALWAERRDVSDGERWRAGEVAAHVTTRFTLRDTSRARDITPKDRLFCDGVEFEIVGIKRGAGRRTTIEITAAARSDGEG